MFRCKMCGNRTLDKSQMRRHMIQCHGHQSSDVSVFDLIATEEVAGGCFSTTSDTPSDSSGSSFDSGGGHLWWWCLWVLGLTEDYAGGRQRPWQPQCPGETAQG